MIEKRRPKWLLFLLPSGLLLLCLIAPRRWEPAPPPPVEETEVTVEFLAGEVDAIGSPRSTALQDVSIEAAIPTDSLVTDEMPETAVTDSVVQNLPLHGPEPSTEGTAEQNSIVVSESAVMEGDNEPQEEITNQAEPPASEEPAQREAASQWTVVRATDAKASDVSSTTGGADPSTGQDRAAQATGAPPESASGPTFSLVLKPNDRSTLRIDPQEAESSLAPEGTKAQPAVQAQDVQQGDNSAFTTIDNRAAWTAPVELKERLAELREDANAGEWANHVLAILDQLIARGGPRSARAKDLLSQLRTAAGEVDRIAQRAKDEGSAEPLRRTGCALERRLIVWEQVAALPTQRDALANARPPEPERLLACLSQVDELTHASPQGEGWRKYLLVDRLRELAESRQEARDKRRHLAKVVLSRLTNRELSGKQRRFATAHSLLALRSELRQWAAEPVDMDQLLRELEVYEESSSGSSGEMVAAFRQQLLSSELPAARELGGKLDDYYRGANFRLVISEALLTRMMPDQDPQDEFVREQVLGMPISGHSYRTTDLAVRLVPDPKRMRFLVVANGLVQAKTSAKATGATVWAGMNSTFQIQKPFEMTLQGLRTDASEADAQTQTHLRRVETPLTGIPLFGSMLDGFVRQQYQGRRRDAERELRQKVIIKAVTEMEGQVLRRVAESNERLREKILIPLERLALQPAVAEMQTTGDRMTLRLRLAADHQLAAQTPRPRAPSDSLASFQIHESVLNNIFNQLDLNGRTFSQAELFRWVAQRLNRPADSIPENLRDDVFLTFAPSDAFRVRAKQGQLEVNLTLDELRAEGKTYRDFTVRVFYRPDDTNGRGELVRDGVVQLIGTHITLRGQVALRGIFSKTFPRERRFSLLPRPLLDNDRLADVRVTQMVLTDGWLGMALGDGRTEVASKPQIR